MKQSYPSKISYFSFRLYEQTWNEVDGEVSGNDDNKKDRGNTWWIGRKSIILLDHQVTTYQSSARNVNRGIVQYKYLLWWSTYIRGINRRELKVLWLWCAFVILMFLPLLFATHHQIGFHHGQMTVCTIFTMTICTIFLYVCPRRRNPVAWLFSLSE